MNTPLGIISSRESTPEEVVASKYRKVSELPETQPFLFAMCCVCCEIFMNDTLKTRIYCPNHPTLLMELYDSQEKAIKARDEKTKMRRQTSGGYQPCGSLDVQNPPQGGSGVPLVRWDHETEVGPQGMYGTVNAPFQD